MDKGKEWTQTPTNIPNPNVPKKNHFYAFRFRGDQEKSLDVFNDMLQVFSVNVYALLDLVYTLSFVTLLVAMNFEVLHDVSNEPFSVSILLGDFILVKRVYWGCPE